MKKIIILAVLFFEIFIMLYSKEVIKEFTLTINICIYALMPTMFFQILFSNILINTNLYKYIPTRICSFFNITKYEGSIILLSMFSGYPNNIKLLNNSKNEYLYYTTNYVNPLFLIVTVGSIYLKNIWLSIIIFISHILSNIIMLYIFRNKYVYENYKTNKSNLYSESLKITIKTLTIIFSNLLVISLLITFLKLILPFKSIINSFILGLLEFSRGIYEISFLNISIYLKGLLILIIITFGSFSIHMQMISINNKIKYIKYLFYRLLNVLISIIVYFIIIFIYTNV
ncbi:MAG: hypothetical protein J6O56_02645 [Bacilli bacterium]|nr:hypothetical protein [Bacilli bacterium]